MTVAALPSRVATPRAVVTCYEFLDALFPACGLLEFTEGLYRDDPTIPLEVAERNQVGWLLDQVGCGPGFELLDIGCGNGTLVEAAVARGASAVGITVSPQQVARCRERKLDVRLLDYRALEGRWEGRFDGVIANGSIEHFVQPDDAASDRADAIYRNLFAEVHRLLNRRSPSRRFATTVIHANERMPRLSPRELRHGPFSFPPGSEKYHYAFLQYVFGGHYPEVGQLDRCAAPWFGKVHQEDGTEDYRLTSEQGLAQIKRRLLHSRAGLGIGSRLAGMFLRYPGRTAMMCWCLLVSESWQHQFRGPNPPTTLLRQTWQAVDR